MIKSTFKDSMKVKRVLKNLKKCNFLAAFPTVTKTANLLSKKGDVNRNQKACHATFFGFAYKNTLERNKSWTRGTKMDYTLNDVTFTYEAFCWNVMTIIAPFTTTFFTKKTRFWKFLKKLIKNLKKYLPIYHETLLGYFHFGMLFL